MRKRKLKAGPQRKGSSVMKTADIHIHVFPDKLAEKAAHSIGEFYDKDPYAMAGTGILLKELEEAGISRCVISNSATTPKQVHNINTFLAEAAREHPGFIGFGSLFPGMDGYEEELDRMQELGLRGLKIHPDFQKVPIDASCGIGMYRSIARRGLPVLFHMGDDRYDYSSPKRLTNLLRKVPDLKVIAAHFGGWTIWEQSLNHPQPENVFYDTSSTIPLVSKEMVYRMFDRFGPERFLFGSDFPMWKPKDAVEQLRSFDLGADVMEKILYGNFCRLLGISED